MDSNNIESRRDRFKRINDEHYESVNSTASYRKYSGWYICNEGSLITMLSIGRRDVADKVMKSLKIIKRTNKIRIIKKHAQMCILLMEKAKDEFLKDNRIEFETFKRQHSCNYIKNSEELQ